MDLMSEVFISEMRVCWPRHTWFTSVTTWQHVDTVLPSRKGGLPCLPCLFSRLRQVEMQFTNLRKVRWFWMPPFDFYLLHNIWFPRVGVRLCCAQDRMFGCDRAICEKFYVGFGIESFWNNVKAKNLKSGGYNCSGFRILGSLERIFVLPSLSRPFNTVGEN